MHTPARTLLSCLLVGAALVACGSTLAGIVRSQAASDLGCPEGQISVQDMRTGNSVRDFSVSGCGRQEHYQAACNMAGSCQAYRPGDTARHPVPASDALTAGPEDLKPADEGVTTAVGEASPEADSLAAARSMAAAERQSEASSPADGPAEAGSLAAGDEAARGEVMALEKDLPPAGTPSTAVASKLPPAEERTVTLRNNCARRVVFYIGQQPGEGDGRYMTLGSTNMISPRLRLGDLVWLLDEKQVGLTSVAVSGRTSEIEVAESCAGLTPR